MYKLAYQRILKPVLFRFDAERVHDIFVRIGVMAGNLRMARVLLGRFYGYRGRDISRTVDGITYRTPIILAAGFDYDGHLVSVLDTLAFGGDEVGSVTARPCSGNPPPRLKRMIHSKSLVVYKGLKNDGVDQVIERLKRKPVSERFVVGISIAKTNDELTESIEAGIDDYFYSLRRLAEEGIGDYYTINISCPTVGGGESFTDPDDLGELLTKLATVNHPKPVYLKMPINHPWENFSKLLASADRHGVHGVVIGNLNKEYQMADHREEAPEEYRGGLSGKPCRDPSNHLIRKTREVYGDRFTIIGCGGILSPADALEKLEAGADLLQLITGMIFEGPHLMKEICAAIAEAGKSGKPASAEQTGRRPGT